MVSNVTVNANTEGGIINIGNAPSLSITGSNFTNVVAKIGGVLWISNCSSNVITTSRFTGTNSSNGPGGVLFFGLSTGFNITNCNFIQCKSQGGNGGAIAINSTSNPRVIVNSNFSGNGGGTSNLGNDFCDISYTVETLLIYSASLISGIISSSAASKFYHQNSSTTLDCLLNNSCQTEYDGVCG
jgi:hypothetical protein